jgi:hypothetical protein
MVHSTQGNVKIFQTEYNDIITVIINQQKQKFRGNLCIMNHLKLVEKQ